MKLKDALLFIAIGIVLSMVFILGRRSHKNEPVTIEVVKIDTLTIIDTVCVERPVLRERRVIDTVLVSMIDTITVRDSLMVQLERDEVVYTDDTTFYAVVSGVMPRLDTLKIYKPTTYIRTKVVTKEVAAPKKHWSFGATVGPAFILKPNGSLDYGLGAAVGLQYNF